MDLLSRLQQYRKVTSFEDGKMLDSANRSHDHNIGTHHRLSNATEVEKEKNEEEMVLSR